MILQRELPESRENKKNRNEKDFVMIVIRGKKAMSDTKSKRGICGWERKDNEGGNASCSFLGINKLTSDT